MLVSKADQLPTLSLSKRGAAVVGADMVGERRESEETR